MQRESTQGREGGMSRRSSLERLPLAVRAAAAAAIGDGRRLARQMPPIAAKMLLYAVIYRYMPSIYRYIPLYVAISRYIPLYPAISR